MKAFDLYPHTCRVCGKRFESSVLYAYKEVHRSGRIIWFCSWRCLRENEKRQKSIVKYSSLRDIV